jgi:hypothetical protein
MLKLIFAVALLTLGESPADAQVDGVISDAHSLPMRFEWRQEGPADTCGTTCRSWVSAVGVITGNTPADFNTFVEGRGVEDAMIVLDSPGGSTLAAMTLGGMIRRLRMTTVVGRTIELPARDGETPQAKLSPDADCESMCAFVLLAGIKRHVPAEARVRVHGIWLGGRSHDPMAARYSAAELAIMQRDLGLLAQYTIEMGGSIELLATAARVPPWEPLRLLLPDELHRMGLTNSDHLFDSRALEIGKRRCDQIDANCWRRAERFDQTR